MGIMNHNAVIASTWNDQRYENVAEWCRRLGSPLFLFEETSFNKTRTIVLVPDGSKEGWPASDAGDGLRAAFIKRLEADQYDDGSSPWEWIEVGYGEYGQTVLRGNNKKVSTCRHNPPKSSKPSNWPDGQLEALRDWLTRKNAEADDTEGCAAGGGLGPPVPGFGPTIQPGGEPSEASEPTPSDGMGHEEQMLYREAHNKGFIAGRESFRAECDRRVEEAVRESIPRTDAYRRMLKVLIVNAKREQMEADCDLLSEMACMERRRESQALRGAVTSIRVAWGMEHK